MDYIVLTMVGIAFFVLGFICGAIEEHRWAEVEARKGVHLYSSED